MSLANSVMAMLKLIVVSWFHALLWFTLQVYFPMFMDSSIYLRFLNELVQMLDKEYDDDSGNAKMGYDKPSSETVLKKLSHNITGKDLDDPNSLWERPTFL